jgi:hypothetical protein
MLRTTAMKYLHAWVGKTAVGLVIPWMVPNGLLADADRPHPDQNGVTYEAFGAVGDGVSDDLAAICKAHAHANKKGLRVRTKADATYHLGRRALTAIIQTDTDWGTSRFIIDDSQGVENHKRPLFEVRSSLKPVPMKIDRLTQGQTRLDLRPASDCLVFVENKNRRIFIRRGLNRNDGTGQKEVFILRRDGSITGAIDWDYDVITRVEAQPIDPQPLVLRGGIFTNIANQSRPQDDHGYWARNIRIRRSNTVVDGVTHRVTGEKDSGNPYSGFLSLHQCADVILRNCRIDDRKVYRKIGNAGKPVAMGTYGYQAHLVVNLQMSKCTMENIHDHRRWGVTATNFMKNFLVEDCVLSRVDVHQGISGVYIIRRSTIGHAGINAIGRGRLVIEDSTLHGGSLLQFRPDYGSTWDGEVLVRNSRWIPRSGNPVMFHMDNDGMHDFGYPCFMPRLIRIEGLFVDDAKLPAGKQGITFFSDPIGPSREARPFPYHLTKQLEVSGLTTASGLPPRVCKNPEVAKAVNVTTKSAVDRSGALQAP